jgi:hypothetical protein
LLTPLRTSRDNQIAEPPEDRKAFPKNGKLLPNFLIDKPLDFTYSKDKHPHLRTQQKNCIRSVGVTLIQYYYKENGLKEIDALLETACRRLAYDFVYR